MSIMSPTWVEPYTAAVPEAEGKTTLHRFESFGKIPRLNKPVVVTEKIDGTNAQVFIYEDGLVLAGSRNRYLTISNDNFGFARWVADNADELRKLGPGRHFGEWWGQGIQRGYGIKEKRFSLFNVAKWGKNPDRPKCCHVVPVLAEASTLGSPTIGGCLDMLAEYGSAAAKGYDHPEGIVVYHSASNQLFKWTFDDTAKTK